MRRRNLLLGVLAAAAGAGGVSACSNGGSTATTGSGTVAPTATPGSPPPVPASAEPILASTTASSLAPREVTPYTPPTGSAPAQAYAVGRRDMSFTRGDRPLPTRVWYPASGTPGSPTPVVDAEPAAGRLFPLVLFSHGLTSTPEAYADILSRWAQAGFVVAGPAYPHTSYGVRDFQPTDIVNQPADASFLLDQLLGMGDPLRAIIDPERLGAAGHSGGGITTVGLFSAVRDPRLKAGVVFAGTDFRGQPFAGPPAAMLYVHGRHDKTVTWQAGHTVFEATPWSRAMLSITDGGHVTEPGDLAPTAGTSTEFLRWALYGDTAARDRIPAAAALDGVATLESQL
ncbi:chlorophyllase-like protein [Krasilnikovia cinnamomea]|uniref:Chlorophyllase-like protein n=1 Tax=Krasilnikovia cinnamomea TaxID=349313 RepID=A0A4Q7ZCB9_9ACTN|nr:chlorophyllase [Krasilnikovia cinnamomea]RZU48297.1 chlorophyllase-like protein [Krasilnikovia cinnamomea]